MADEDQRVRESTLANQMPYRASEVRVPRPPPLVRRRWLVVIVAVLGALGVAVVGVRSVIRTAAIAPPSIAQEPAEPIGPCSPWLASAPHDGATEVIDGARRLTVTWGGRVTTATSNLHANIVAAERGPDGWLFVDRSGLVEQSATFLGPLRTVGRFPACFRRFVTAPVGSIAAIDGEGRLWIADARRGLNVVSLPDRVVRAAFRNGPVGAAVLSDGRLMRTSDGGRNWSVSDLGLNVASDVYATPRGLVARTTAGTLPVDWEGVVDPAVRPNAVRSPRGVVSDGLRTIVRSTPDTGQRVERREHELCPGEHGEREDLDLGPFGGRVYTCTALEPSPRRSPSRDLPHLGDAHLMFDERGATAWSYHPRGTGSGPGGIVEWDGVDELGPFRMRTNPIDRWFSAPRDQYGSGAAYLIVATRMGVLFGGNSEHGSALGWGTSDGDFRFVADPFVAEHRHLAHSSLALPDGGTIVALATSDVRFGRVVVLLVVGPDGSVRRRRGYLSTSDAFPLAALWDGVPGVVVGEARDTMARRFVPVDGTRDRAIGWPHLSEMAACAEGRSSGAIVYMPLPFNSLEIERAPRELVAIDAEVELGSDSACVRAWTVGDAYRPTMEGELIRLTAAPGDRFVGRTRCRLHPDSEALVRAAMQRASNPMMRHPMPLQRAQRCTDGDFVD